MSLEAGSGSNARRAWSAQSIPMRGEPEGREKCSMLLVNENHDARHQAAHDGGHRGLPNWQSGTGLLGEFSGGLSVHRKRVEQSALQQAAADAAGIGKAVSDEDHRLKPGPGDEANRALAGLPAGAAKAGAAPHRTISFCWRTWMPRTRIYPGQPSGTCSFGLIRFITSPTMRDWRRSRCRTSTT